MRWVENNSEIQQLMCITLAEKPSRAVVDQGWLNVELFLKMVFSADVQSIKRAG